MGHEPPCFSSSKGAICKINWRARAPRAFRRNDLIKAL